MCYTLSNLMVTFTNKHAAYTRQFFGGARRTVCLYHGRQRLFVFVFVNSGGYLKNVKNKFALNSGSCVPAKPMPVAGDVAPKSQRTPSRLLLCARGQFCSGLTKRVGP